MSETANPIEGHTVTPLGVTARTPLHATGKLTSVEPYELMVGVVPPIDKTNQGLQEFSRWLRTLKEGVQDEIGYRTRQDPDLTVSKELIPIEDGSAWGTVVTLTVMAEGFSPNPSGDATADRVSAGIWREKHEVRLWNAVDALGRVVSDAVNRHVDPGASERHRTRLGYLSIARPNLAETQDL